jgi:ABC-type nitrate/sulfonate/bicarbonate transport system substrate-binding protein
MAQNAGRARRLSCMIGLLAVLAVGTRPMRAGAEDGGYELPKLRYLGSYSAVTPPELAEDLGYLAPIRLDWVGDTTSGPQDIQTVVTGDVDFGGAFNGSIVRLIAAGGPIKAVIGVMGSNTTMFSGIYVLANNPIRSGHDLIGKKIGVNTLRAGAEFFLDNYLEQAGLAAADIDQITLAVLPPVGQEQALRQGQIDAAIMSGLFEDRAVERGGLRLLTTDTRVFGNLTGASEVLTDAFISRYPKTSRHFVEATAKALDWARTHPREEVLARFRGIIERRNRHEDASVVQYWKSYGVDAPGGLLTDRDFAVSIDWYRRHGDTAAGNLRPSDIYTNALNPYRRTADR